MRQIRQFLTMATLAVMGAMMAGCATEDNIIVDGQQPADQTRTITLTTTVTLDGASATRTLEMDNVNEKVLKTFAVDDQIAVKYYKRTENWAYKIAISNKLTTNDITEGGKKATFTVTLDDPDPNKTEVRYVYPAYLESDNDRARILQNEQNGTLTTLASTFDYCEGSGSIDHSGATPTLPSITLENQLTLAKFTVSDGSSDITSGVTQLIIDCGTRGYVVNRTAAAGPIWVAMYPIATSQTVKVTAVKGTDLYQSADITGKELAKNNYYNITVTTPQIVMSNIAADYKQPLTFHAKGGAAKVKFTLESVVTNPVEYSIDNGTTWTTYTSEQEIELDAADKTVMFRGNNAAYGDGGSASKFSVTNGSCYVYGNVMSLVNATAFPVVKTLTAPYAFTQMFNSCNNIYNYGSNKIVLPAKTLTSFCYKELFYSCRNLTTAPELPATTLAEGCYNRMFGSCSNLTSAPVLPATTLVHRCYDNMFCACENLTTAPELPATTLAYGCYCDMFRDCSNLTTAPELPATTLVNFCYSSMFENCQNLNYVKCLATVIPAENCTNRWLEGVSNSGTFVVNSSLTILEPEHPTTTWVSYGLYVAWDRGSSSIPNDWSVQCASE